MCVGGGLAASSSTPSNATVCITPTASALTQEEEGLFLHTYSSSLYSQSHHISTKDADDGWLAVLPIRATVVVGAEESVR